MVTLNTYLHMYIHEGGKLPSVSEFGSRFKATEPSITLSVTEYTGNFRNKVIKELPTVENRTFEHALHTFRCR
jgi:hypothetical protein